MTSEDPEGVDSRQSTVDSPERDESSPDVVDAKAAAPKVDLAAFENVDAVTKDDAFAALRGSWGFPAFARDFPNDAELATLVASFVAGDYGTVRTGAPALAAKATSDDVKRAALTLRAHIEPDPTSRVFFGLAAALMVFLFVWWVTHDGPQHHAPAPARPPPAVEFVK